MEAHHHSNDSYQSRSREGSQISLGESRLQRLNLNDASNNLTVAGTSSSFGRPASLSADEPRRSQAGQASRSYSPYSISSAGALSQNWPYINPSQPSDDPSFSTELPQENFTLPTIITRIAHPDPRSFDHEDMSTLSIQFDARFDAGARPSYTWPVFDINDSYGTGELSGMDPFSEPNAVLYSRSLSASPSHGGISAEQRELKRQHDQARRSSKTRFRRERSSSNSYSASQAPTPDLQPPGNVINYSSAITATPITADPALPLSVHSYLSAGPAQISASSSPELYCATFPLMSNEFVGGYLMPYSSAPPDSLTVPTYSNRALTLPAAPEQSFLYRNLATNNVSEQAQDTVRVVHSRPKPQCWDHGCNGRQFSTFSNLLRHQREKSGVASKPTCPKCGAEFTRTTARNGHMAHEKCKQRRNS